MGQAFFGRPTGIGATRLCAGILAALIFVADGFTATNIAAAALYGLVVLVAAPALSRPGVLKVAGACGLLTIVGYLAEHGAAVQAAPLVRGLISLVALAATTALALKTKLAHEAIAVSERRYRTIFESTASGLWEKDYSGIAAALRDAGCRSASDLERLGERDPQKVLALMRETRTLDANGAAVRLLAARDKAQLMTSLDEIFTPESLPLVKGMLTARLERQPLYQGEARLRRFNGELMTAFISARFGADDDFDRVFVSAADVTDRVRAEEALRQARDELAHVTLLSAISELSAALAHEVNQPLAAVVTNGEACLRWLDRPEPDLGEARACVVDAISGGRRAAEVVRRLGAIVKKGAPEWTYVDANQVVRESAALLDRELRSHGVALALDLEPGAPRIRADRLQLQQVLVNLMLNAAEAMSGAPSKAVCLQTRLEDVGVRIAVGDCGPGMTEEVMNRLFTPFFTTKTAGMGMGLAICRSIVNSHGGRIWAENRPGDGATFFVRLPREAERRS